MHVDSTGKQTVIEIAGLNRMVELAHGLYQSGEPGTGWGPTADEITEAGIDVIVNLYGRGHVPLQPGMLFMLWLVYDGPELPSIDALHDMADYLTRLIASGKKVLIHCQAGLNRSSLLAALVLMRVQGLNGPQAMARIRERRSPDALCNTTFAAFLESLT
jgi:hypothetical protein